jgi:hypothetical protein
MALEFILSSHTKDEKKGSCDLVTECFGRVLGAMYEREYDWLFLENPAGAGVILIAYDGQKPVGQICSIPCKYKFMGRHIPTAIAGEWICVSPMYRGKGLMSELIRRRITDDQRLPFVLDLPNKASMNGFVKAGYRQMNVKLLTRPLKLSKCFVHNKIPKIVLKPFDMIWKYRGGNDNAKFFIEEYSLPMFDSRFDEFLKDGNNHAMIKQVHDSEFLKWRYGNSSKRNYRTIISVGEDGRLYGYIIIRIAIAYGIKVGFILDFLARHSESGRNLIYYALRYFWDSDAAIAASLCFPNCMEYMLLRKEGFFICPQRLRPNPYILCVRPSSKIEYQFDTSVLIDSKRWSFMFGDFQVY